MSYAAAATLDTLRRRAAILSVIREFFAARGMLEVDTPALSSAGVPDTALESIVATAHGFGSRPYYLQTSPEYAMKRLLAGGSGDIYQICRVFRDDELGRWHQPEFTLLEWYRVGWDELELMTEVEALLRAALARGAAPADRGAPPAWRAARMRYAEAFDRCLGFDLADDTAALVERLRARGIDVPAGLDRDATLDLALSTAIVPQLERGALTFIHDFPPSQAALARIKPGPPPVAARFEAFAGGIELANGFAELTDAAEQRRRFEADLEARRRAGRGMPPLDEDFLAALARGLPECAGVAVGLDRLVALACGLDDVAGAVSFAHVPPRA